MPPSRDHGRYRYKFGAVDFDEAKFELRVAGLAVELQRKPLEVLTILLRRAGEVVTKEELFETVWAGRVTVENVLANAVKKLRNALGEENATYVVTIPRVGYRFNGRLERFAVGRGGESSFELSPGMAVPRRENFRLESLLGQSKGSEVWLTRHRKTGLPRVYKFSVGGERLAALKREVMLSRVLRETLGDREEFAKVIDWNFETSPFFLECEYGGENLAQWAETDGRLANMPEDDRIELFLQIADAIAAAHSVGVLHKDIKATNVLIQPRENGWRIQITDFGSGRLLDPERLAELGITELGLTIQQGIGLDSPSATLLYLAPEVIAGQPPTVQSDVYALGLLLYQIVVGNLRKPLVSGWQRDIADELLREDIAEATDGNPELRLKTAADLADRLRRRATRNAFLQHKRAVEGAALEAQRALQRSRARRPWVMATFATLAIGFATSVALYLRAMESTRSLAQQYQIVKTLNGFLTTDFIGAANPSVTGRSDVTVAEAAKAAALKIDVELGDNALEEKAELHRAMQEAFSGLTDYGNAIAEGSKALSGYLGQHSPDIEKVIAVRLRLVSDLNSVSKVDEAAEMLRLAQLDIKDAHLEQSAYQIRYWYLMSHIDANRFALPESLADVERAWKLVRTTPNVPEDLRENVELRLHNAGRLQAR
jgi:eukaryotic-like serine/threonine-protein kinase